MTPKQQFEAQIEKCRAMSGEERLNLAFDLRELSCQSARDGIRQQHPEASADQGERLLRERTVLAQPET